MGHLEKLSDAVGTVVRAVVNAATNAPNVKPVDGQRTYNGQPETPRKPDDTAGARRRR